VVEKTGTYQQRPLLPTLQRQYWESWLVVVVVVVEAALYTPFFKLADIAICL
jgi:hypothetical protein